MVGRGEGGVGIAIAHIELGQQIVRAVLMGGGRAGFQGIAAIGDGGKDIVIDIDQLGRVLGNIAAIGDDHADRFADMDDFALGERRAVAVLLVAGAGQADHEVFVIQIRHQVVQRQNRVDARNL
jgi:hypothetical protein